MMQRDDPTLPERTSGSSDRIFEWPCERRKAHAPHPRDQVTDEAQCPGVRAHPKTMIGGKFDG